MKNFNYNNINDQLTDMCIRNLRILMELLEEKRIDKGDFIQQAVLKLHFLRESLETVHHPEMKRTIQEALRDCDRMVR